MNALAIKTLQNCQSNQKLWLARSLCASNDVDFQMQTTKMRGIMTFSAQTCNSILCSRVCLLAKGNHLISVGERGRDWPFGSDVRLRPLGVDQPLQWRRDVVFPLRRGARAACAGVLALVWLVAGAIVDAHLQVAAGAGVVVQLEPFLGVVVAEQLPVGVEEDAVMSAAAGHPNRKRGSLQPRARLTGGENTLSVAFKDQEADRGSSQDPELRKCLRRKRWFRP